MKFGTLVTIALLTFNYYAYGQDSLSYHGQPFIRDLPTKIKATNPPLYIIKTDNRVLQVPTTGNFTSKRKVKRAFKHFDIDWIDSINVLKGESAIEKYGTLGQNGVVIINLKEGTFAKLPRRLKKYQLDE